MKVNLQPAYILSLRPYRETSALVEVFTQNYGRVGLVAKGVRQQRSKIAGLLQPFRSLLLSWVGRGDLVTLVSAEITDGDLTLVGEGLVCAFYLNELLLRLLSRYDPFEALFLVYTRSLLSLTNLQQRQQALRLFERDLLAHLGYGPLLQYEADTYQPIEAEQWYNYKAEKGPQRFHTEDLEGMRIQGRTLLNLAQGQLTDPVSLRESKYLLRWLLSFYLGSKPLKSQYLLKELRQFSNNDKKRAAHDHK
ncbi:DNA repair protein RecO [Candidatus Nitrosoglobus terrae]|uniref:DNA repair protein RecO n=1 Tax=Candidatus Nitrosoglobus terrae TaxID=1630141 RepID=A0A1Q2SLS0_9GAMM|nr:DNA repair protein RecO [Candidatus Nitrosoglobus terrae]BAW80071.1 DNA repair protein RecO [Candidatus Nitrosoglobus terrae]